MFLLNLLHYGYSKFIDLLTENDKKYTDKDIIIQMIILGTVLILFYLSTYYIPYVILILMSMSK